jgi:hypothetical protein
MRPPSPPTHLLAALVLASSLVFATKAAAASEPGADAAPEKGGRGALSLAFTGGLMMPRGEFADSRGTGLTAGINLALTSRSGFGVALGAEYAPLPPQGAAPPSPASRESHVGLASLAPRITIGQNTVRAWLAAGGALLLDYEETSLAGAPTERSFRYRPIAMGAIGLELHTFDSGGLVAMGRYGRSLGGARHEVITATGGLLLEF